MTEVAPWFGAVPYQPSTQNFTQFNASALSTSQYLYNPTTLPHGSQYLADPSHNSFVLRRLLRQTQNMSCASVLLGLPGVIFYNTAMNGIVCASLDARDTIQERGVCLIVQYLTIPIAHECLWINKGDEITNTTNDSDVYTMTFVMTQYWYPSLLWLKFVVRCIAFVMVALCLWTEYYGHYFALARTLAQHGHQHNLDKTVVWRYHLVAGDPMVILVSNKYVVGAFFVDQWLSPHTIGEVVLRLLELRDAATTIGAGLFLFRMIWFAYGSICSVNYYLKRTRREYMFAEIDPTVLSMFALFYIPSIWLIFGNSVLCLEFCQWLQICLLSETSQHERIEIVLVGVVCIFIIAAIPLVYGFMFGHWRRPPTVPRHYSSFRYNSLKNRAFFSAVHPLRHGDRVATSSFGGNIYMLFALSSSYKARPAMNARGSDCFVLCYSNDKLASIFRLSLLSSLDVNARGLFPVVQVEKDCSPYHMNLIKIENSGAGGLSCQRQSFQDQDMRIVLQRSRSPSVWCI